MKVDIEVKDISGIAIVRIGGQLGSTTSGEVMDRLNELAKGGGKKMILNLRDLEYISSAGLRSILVPAKLLKSSDGELRICEANPSVRKVLETSGFSALVSLHDTEREALLALG